MLSKDHLKAVAEVVRGGKQISQNVLLDLLDGCVDLVDHYQSLASRWVADEDRTGYHPYVVTNPDGDQQVLIQIYTDEHGKIDMVQIATRENQWDSWSPPVSAKKG